jgi:farnesyl-diphosphate farnesyltransferase
MNDSLDNNSILADESYQEHILQGVSRTFALTIPQLPEGLRKVVSNAYLLCRIADTIEDDNALTSDQTREFSNMFIDVVAGNNSAQTFSDALHPLLSDHTIEAEHDLIRHVPAVIRITHNFNLTQRQALERCIRIMAKGMADYQDAETLEGVEDLPAMDKYCYYVAGVVGEMLTELFCDYSEEIITHREDMMRLAVSFGQGLQMTNILKDIWDDRSRGACWLPRDIFREEGFELRNLKPGCQDENFHRGLGKLIAVACDHLRDALTYTLMIPAQEAGIRRFCLWALGMAVLTLNNLNKQRDYSSGAQIKISRRSVRATVFFTSLFVRQDRILRLFFDLMSRNLPVSDIREKLYQARRQSIIGR